MTCVEVPAGGELDGETAAAAVRGPASLEASAAADEAAGQSVRSSSGFVFEWWSMMTTSPPSLRSTLASGARRPRSAAALGGRAAPRSYRRPTSAARPSQRCSKVRIRRRIWLAVLAGSEDGGGISNELSGFNPLYCLYANVFECLVVKRTTIAFPHTLHYIVSGNLFPA